MMARQALWNAVLDTTRDLEHAIAAEVGALPQRGPVASVGARTSVPQIETAWRDLGPLPTRTVDSIAAVRVVEPDDRDRASLGRLREEVGARVQRLWESLEVEGGTEAIRRALVIYFDERVMRALPEYLRVHWPLLQSDLTHSRTGGVDFFRFVDRALDDPKTPSLVFEVYYYCLSHGFEGQYTKQLVRLERYREEIAARITTAKPHRSDATDVEGRAPGAPWPPWAYYVCAILLVVLVIVAATAWSNHESEDRPDPSSAPSLVSSSGALPVPSSSTSP